jgi:uncharacterized SAM-binding protein YcdF (DUF218 family)
MENSEESRPAASPGGSTAKSQHPLARLYRLVRGLLAAGMLVLLVLVLTPIPERVHDWLDVSEPLRRADYIVCLGGNPQRLVWAIEAYSRGFAPKVIVTNLPGATEWMAERLVDAGIPRKAILRDDHSATTADHPGNIAKLPGVDREQQQFLIVTDYDHSRRAAGCFRRAGYRHFTIYGAGFGYPPEKKHPLKWRIGALARLSYECVGMAKYWVTGKI